MKILNLTQHQATPEQIRAGVAEPDDYLKGKIRTALTFLDRPDQENIRKRAEELALIALTEEVKFAMIGGAPYLMADLETALLKREITPLYSFSKRVVEEVKEGDTVKKIAVFKHGGFISKHL